MTTCLIRLLTPDGALLSAAYHADSLSAAALHEPQDGVYTVTNTYNTYQTLKLDAHLDRLEDSAMRAGIPLMLDRDRLRHALRQMIGEMACGNVRFRVTVPRDAAHLILSMESFPPLPAALTVQGVCCVTIPDSARSDSLVKSTGWMTNRLKLIESLSSEVYEALLLDSDGYVLEGTSSNLYVIWDGSLYTAGEGVLAGISRTIVLEIAPEILPVCLSPVHLRELSQVQEAFMTSSSRGIIPVVQIDDLKIGDGSPGQMTRKLRQVYDIWVHAHLEDL